MFEDVEQRTSARFAEVLAFLNHLKINEPQSITDPQPLHHRIGRGLAIVHLYAAIEKSINDIVTNAIIEIDSVNAEYKHLKIDFHPIAAHGHLMSYKDCSAKNALSKAADIFGLANDNALCSLNETMFGYSLQNVWVATIDEVRRCFGLEATNLSPLERSLLNSIVENRNKVAHGRESAGEVGRTIVCDHLIRLHDVSLAMCEQTTVDFRHFIENRKFVKPHYKNRYA